jgi:hypothetical protein
MPAPAVRNAHWPAAVRAWRRSRADRREATACARGAGLVHPTVLDAAPRKASSLSEIDRAPRGDGQRRRVARG